MKDNCLCEESEARKGSQPIPNKAPELEKGQAATQNYSFSSSPLLRLSGPPWSLETPIALRNLL